MKNRAHLTKEGLGYAAEISSIGSRMNRGILPLPKLTLFSEASRPRIRTRSKISLNIDPAEPATKKYYSIVNNTFSFTVSQLCSKARRSFISSLVQGNASKGERGTLSETVSFKE